MKRHHYIFLTFILSFISCDNYLDIEPVGQVIPKSVEEYRSFLTSAYSIEKDYKVLTAYRGDELSLASNSVGVEQYKDIFIWNDENQDPSTRSISYSSLYNTIFYTNEIINNSETIVGNTSKKEQLVGEAYALRAMTYFELVNLYAKPYNKLTANTDLGVPVTTAYDPDKSYPRETVQKVYDVILNDIDNAETFLNIDQQDIGFNYRFSILAVKALKSRVYLYQQEWQKAIDLANEALVIKSALQDLNSNVTSMPLEYNSVESILALETVASFDIANNTTISNSLLVAYNQTEDLRFSLYFQENTNGTYSSKKNADFKFKSSYRVAELYLNRIESLIQLKNADLAKEQLIAFTKNRYTPTGWEDYKIKVNGLGTDALLTEVLEERRREFAIEGQRWNDLRRTTQQEIIKVFDGVSYTLDKNDERYVIPFPDDAIINNPDL